MSSREPVFFPADEKGLKGGDLEERKRKMAAKLEKAMEAEKSPLLQIDEVLRSAPVDKTTRMILGLLRGLYAGR